MDYTILVNKNFYIPDDYLEKIKLVSVKDVDGNEIFLEEKTSLAYNNLKDKLKESEIIIHLESGYRDVNKQIKIMDEYKKTYGEEHAKKYVAKPKTSEHHTGLALDIFLEVDGKIITNNNELLKQEDIFRKIHSQLADFGFILRYPLGKENITKYPYEPWHFRYVGENVAKIIMNENLTLEEYKEKYTNGVLVVNKEKNMTSRDVVNEVSRILGTKKIGHTGTLDPLAEGVLVLTIGKATKIAELLTANEKEYIAEVLVGLHTDTLDVTGNIIEEKNISNFSVKNTLPLFKKTYMQEVPIYSAVKVNGKKLYDYARCDEKVKLPKKEVTIKEIELLEEKNNTFKFKCLVSKGTYIRSLIRDIGEYENVPMTMKNLIRTKQGKFSLNDAYSIDEIRNNNYKLYKIEEVLDYPKIYIDKEELKKVLNGVSIKNRNNITDKCLMIYKSKLLAIYEVNGNILKPWKVFETTVK